MLKPVHLVAAARLALLIGSLVVAGTMLGAFQDLWGLSGGKARAIVFGGLLALSFLAFPDRRRNDLAIAVLVLSAALEAARTIGHPAGAFADWFADAAGVAAVYGIGMIETVRKLARDHGEMSFAWIAEREGRRTRRRRATAFRPADHAAAPGRFADRAARRFPVR